MQTKAPEWAAIESITGKIGCTAETSRRWVRRATWSKQGKSVATLD